ncbi:MAG: NAD-dependent epimerase/dehydratase family protein [Mesorhizobium sp.]
MTKTIVVLGAAGRVANEVGRAFLEAGYKVRAVTRNGREVLPGAEHAAADAADLAQLERAIKGADFVFNGLNPLYHEWAQKVMPMARNVATALRGRGTTQLFIGNVYPYGSPMSEVLREDTPMRPSNEKGRIRLAMKELFRAEAEQHGTQTIIIRAGDFFGAGSGTWFDQALASKLDKGVFTAPGKMDLVHAWAYLPDLAQAFVAAANVADTLPRFEVFNFPGHAVTLEEFKSAIERSTGRPLKTRFMPWWVLRLVGVFNPIVRELVAMNYLWREPHRLVSDRIEQVLGPLPHTPLDKAVAQTLQDMRRQKAA